VLFFVSEGRKRCSTGVTIPAGCMQPQIAQDNLPYFERG